MLNHELTLDSLPLTPRSLDFAPTKAPTRVHEVGNGVTSVNDMTVIHGKLPGISRQHTYMDRD
jgi:hypothetical protein